MVAANKHTGEVPLTIGKKKGTLVLNWRALAALKAEFTQDDLMNLMGQSPDKLAKMLEIGFSTKNPEITADVIMNESPVVEECCRALDRALLYAYHGPEKAKEIIDQIEKVEKAAKGAVASAAKKKTR